MAFFTHIVWASISDGTVNFIGCAMILIIASVNTSLLPQVSLNILAILIIALKRLLDSNSIAMYILDFLTNSQVLIILLPKYISLS